MKAIKIILGIITAIVLVFFATGLFVKETKYTTAVTINKPIEEVFKEFNNPQKFKQWIPELVSLAPLNENIGKIGSTYIMIVKNGKQELKMDKKILAYIPNKKVVFSFNTKDMLKTEAYTFSSKDNKTHIVKVSSHKSKSYIMGCVYPYFKGKIQGLEQQYLDRFKKVAEQ